MQEASSKQQAKQNLQTKSSADRITTSSSFHHQRKNKQAKKKKKKEKKKKLSTNLTLYEAYTSHCTNLRKAEPKRKKEFNLEPWEKDISNTIN